jgi:glycosyltransferase involved in cell wall biosynthesis
VAVSEIDLDASLQSLLLDAPAACVRVLVRLRGRPVGWVDLRTDSEAKVDPRRLRHAVMSELGWQLARLVLARTEEPLQPPAEEPAISVVVCTRDRPAELEGCLAALVAVDYRRHEIFVVDNASVGDATAAVAERFGVSCVREERPGLNWARNRGIAESQHPIVAFTDDDACVDRLWLAGLARAFEDPAVDAVTGLVVPLELDTPAQRMFEYDYGGMGKGFQARSFQRDWLTPHQLVGIQAAGVGTNMAFRRELFSRIGKFDTVLDVGTPSRGGGDLDLFHRAVAGGAVLRYEPYAVVWHRHRRTTAELERQLADDGRAFAIYLMKLWRTRSMPRRHVLSFAVRKWLRWLIGRLVRGILRRHALPLPLLWAPVRAALFAPIAYAQAERADRRLRRRDRVVASPPNVSG